MPDYLAEFQSKKGEKSLLITNAPSAPAQAPRETQNSLPPQFDDVQPLLTPAPPPATAADPLAEAKAAWAAADAQTAAKAAAAEAEAAAKQARMARLAEIASGGPLPQIHLNLPQFDSIYMM
jgi:hypothetical protein